MPGSGESHWNKVRNCYQRLHFCLVRVAKDGHHSQAPLPTPSVTRITMGTISFPCCFSARAGDELHSGLAPQLQGNQLGEKLLLTLCRSGECPDGEAHGWMSTHPQRMIEAKMDLLKAHHNIQRSLVEVVVTSCRKSRKALGLLLIRKIV